jgi:dTDP-4-amino-4,6-dideoxygalactose transaminase
VEASQPLKIPSVDFKRQYPQYGEELEKSVIEVLRSCEYILGSKGAELEAQVARLCGCKYAVGVANGTDALILALWALDIGPGDEVITPAFTFAATAEAIILRGAKPVFVDVIPETFNINPALAEKLITPATKAILPVHLYGQTVDMQPLIEIAKRYKLKLIEDNAQAIGAQYFGKPTGSMSDLGSISFYPTKNLGAAGDAGMVVTNDLQLCERLQSLHAHGMKQRYYHDEIGVNSRLDEVQAAVMLSKLKYLEQWNETRRQIAERYTQLLRDIPGIILPQVPDNMIAVWHQYTVRVLGRITGQSATSTLRDQVKEKLAAQGVGSAIYYPVPLHLQKAFSCLGYKKGDFPESERLSDEVLSLPMYSELTEEELSYVADALRKVMNEVLSENKSSLAAAATAGMQPVAASVG